MIAMLNHKELSSLASLLRDAQRKFFAAAALYKKNPTDLNKIAKEKALHEMRNEEYRAKVAVSEILTANQTETNIPKDLVELAEIIRNMMAAQESWMKNPVSAAQRVAMQWENKLDELLGCSKNAPTNQKSLF